MTDTAHMLTAWLLCLILVGVVIFVVIQTRKRYVQIRAAKEGIEASRHLRKDFALTISKMINEIEKLPATMNGCQQDRDTAHLLKKFCKFVGYPFRVEIDIDVRSDATHVTITMPDTSELLVQQQMIVARFNSGALATYLTSESFRNAGEGNRFRMYGY